MEMIPFLRQEDAPHDEAIKWSIGNNRYEIYHTILDTFDVDKTLPHVLTFRSKVDTTVGVAAHKGPSLYQVFPRTLSLVLRGIWETINESADNDPAMDNTQTSDNFDNRLREFIAINATEDSPMNYYSNCAILANPETWLSNLFGIAWWN